jgi:methionyl aminopeptidase
MYSSEQLKKIKKAGKIAATARDYGASLIKVGAYLLEVTEKIEKKIKDLGGDFAFPPQISLNDIAAHYCAEPKDETIFKKGDLAKLDVGVHIDGFIGDTALTIDLGENRNLVRASRDAVDNAISIIKPGITLGEIGKVIQESIQKYGYSPVRNLSGHGLGEYEFHKSPNIPNIETNDKTELKKGQLIAIEPFATSGRGMIYESSNANIFSQINKKPVRNIITRKILKEIEKYKGLPFTTRWLTYKFNPFKVKFALRELLNKDIIKSYPPLPEKTHAVVSQAEHTLIVDDPVIVTTKI